MGHDLSSTSLSAHPLPSHSPSQQSDVDVMPITEPTSWNFPQLSTPQTSPCAHPTRSFALHSAQAFHTSFVEQHSYPPSVSQPHVQATKTYNTIRGQMNVQPIFYAINAITSERARTAIAHAAGAGVAVRRAEPKAFFPACAVTAALTVCVGPALPCVHACVGKEAMQWSAESRHN